MKGYHFFAMVAFLFCYSDILWPFSSVIHVIMSKKMMSVLLK